MSAIIRDYRGDRYIDIASFSHNRIPFSFRRQLTHLIVLSMRPDIKDLEIRHEVSGRPYLYSSKALVDLPLISISHSGSWIGVLLSDFDAYAALDLEDMTLPRSYTAISNNFFSETEKNLVLEQGILGFFKLWTAKEAMAKWHGEGIDFALKVEVGHSLQNVVLQQPIPVEWKDKKYILLQNIFEESLFYTICRGV